jgi:hypothetical protein
MEVVAGDVDLYLFLEVFDDGSVELLLLGWQISMDGCFDDSEAEVQRLTREERLLYDILVPGCFEHGLEVVDGFLVVIEADGIGLCADFAHLY